jgi:nucleoside-diphosphate-sugar epimerase
MRVLVLGGTGSIGAPMVRTLVKRGHEVVALARSDSSAEELRAFGALPLPGDIRQPQEWLTAVSPCAAVIHVASEFEGAMQEIESRLLDALLPCLADSGQKRRFIYTGGCWLFGATGDRVATEATPFAPLAAFEWSPQHMRRILESPGVEAVIIHPAMVYERDGGVFSGFARDAAQRRPVRLVGGEHVRWPLVHSADLADLYVLALERGIAGESYIGSAISGLSVGSIARAFARRHGGIDRELDVIPVDTIAAELGDWARGYALDQQLSGEKARSSLHWKPMHLDPMREIAAFT